MRIETKDIVFTKGRFFKLLLVRYLIKKVAIYMIMIATLIFSIFYQSEQYLAHIAIAVILVVILYEIYNLYNYVSSQTAPKNYRAYSLLIKDSGVSIIENGESKKIKWDQFKKYQSFPGGLILLYDHDSMVFIDKKALLSPKQWAELTAAIRGKF